MKNFLTILTLTAGLIATATTFANDAKLASDDRVASVPVSIDTQDLGDDICWVAPEWRDS